MILTKTREGLKTAVVGAGYVGIATAVGLAEQGRNIVLVIEAIDSNAVEREIVSIHCMLTLTCAPTKNSRRGPLRQSERAAPATD